MDLQLRGRAGRQGNPGESQFFVSLDDEMLVRFGIRGLIPAACVPPPADTPVESRIVTREIARTQRIAEGQNLEIRRTLARYTDVVARQRAALAERRGAILRGEEAPGVWERTPERASPLVAAAGELAVREAERVVMLASLDGAWRDHLAFLAEVREGIHLVRLGGHDPLARFTSDAIRAFSELVEVIDQMALSALSKVHAVDGRIDITGTALRAPSPTWTYLINDDPFRHRIGSMLTGPGGVKVAIYAAAIMAPLLMAWGLVSRLRGRPHRRGTI